MKELRELYPSVSSKLSFRLSPYGNITFTDKTGRLKTLKDDAWFIYSLCDGQKKMKEILHDILMECDTNEETILNFLLDANKREYIVFKNAKEFHKINIYGDTENYYPTYASVVLTEKCNISCIYCYGNYSPAKSTYLSFEDAKKIFLKLKEKGLVGLELSGGEPLTNPDFLKILNLAFEEFNHISILSNGILFNKKIFEIINTYNEKCSVQISIDGLTEKTNLKVRRARNTWKGTLNTIHELIKLKINFRVVYMVTKENINELLPAAELMRKIGVKKFLISITDGIGRGSDLNPDNYSLNNSKSKYFGKITEIVEQTGLKYKDILFDKKTKLEELQLDKLDNSNCGAGWLGVVVHPNGDVSACQLLGKSYILGNLLNDNIQSIFNGKEINNLYRTFSKSNLEECCSECNYSTFCGNCLTRILFANKELKKRNEDLCPIAKKFNLDQVFDEFKFDVSYKI